MQLCDWEIEDAIKSGELGFKPFDPDLLQPASIDVRLGSEFRTENGLAFSVRNSSIACEAMVPNQFILGHTEEWIRLPSHLSARIEGKSSIGRLGLMIHVSAGFVDPGFEGQMTLELKNLSALKQIRLFPGMLIAQISFHRMSAVPRRIYGSRGLDSHYQGQMGPTESVLKR
jgi:dCTP deaminase